ncbi:hypothetical protein KR018_001125 [Drosophila ironensis]|nr:hypothetical protein KR018_001125 [Drosophila ironensis]
MDTQESLAVAIAEQEQTKIDPGTSTEPNTWPTDTEVHEPPVATQLLLPERASGLAVHAYLRLCRLPYAHLESGNAEFMSPGGRLTRLPLFRQGPVKVLAEFEPIVTHVESTQPDRCLGRHLSEEQREDMRCAVAYAENVFTMAELHMCYKDPLNYRLYTHVRCSAVHPWPLRVMRRFSKKREAMRLLKVYQWDDLDNDQVLEEVAVLCSTLSARLGERREFFYGSQACQLDAMVFGHVAAIISVKLPNSELADLMLRYPKLVAHSRRLDRTFFEGKLLREEEDEEMKDELEDEI